MCIHALYSLSFDVYVLPPMLKKEKLNYPREGIKGVLAQS